MYRIVWASVAALLALLSGACSSSDGDGASSATTTQPPTTKTTATRAPVVVSGEEWIAFNGVRPGISLIRADGTGAHVILGRRRDQRDPDWSPDGSEIAYMQGGSPRITDVQGRHPRWLITSVPADLRRWRWASPAWSPDGSQVAVVGYGRRCCTKPLRSVLATAHVATGKLTRVWEPPAGRIILSPRWSPDGQAIVLTVARFTCNNGCDAFRGSEVTVIRTRGGAWSAPKAITDVGRYGAADWHPTQDLILFGDNDIVGLVGADAEPTHLYTIRSDGREQTALRSFGSAERPGDPTWTPDGRIMVTLETVDEKPRGIALLNADGSGLTVIVPADMVGQGARPRVRPR